MSRLDEIFTVPRTGAISSRTRRGVLLRNPPTGRLEFFHFSLHGKADVEAIPQPAGWGIRANSTASLEWVDWMVAAGFDHQCEFDMRHVGLNFCKLALAFGMRS